MKIKLRNVALLTVLFLFVTGFSNTVFSQKLGQVVEIEDFEDLYQSDDFYMGGQPSLDMLKWLKSEGVELIINLRTERENNRFTESTFNEEEMLVDMNIEYKSIPIAYPEGYSPESLDMFTEALLESKGKVFIHCASGGRVRSFMMAYIVKEKGYTVNEAIEFGKELGYMFALEDILGKEIKMTIED